MYLNTTLVQRKADLDREIALIKKELNRLPQEGALILNNSKGGIQWYVKAKDQNGIVKRTYIKRRDRKFAEALARKTFFRKMLADKENESKSLELYLQHRTPKDYRHMLCTDSPYRDLLPGSNWDMAEYEKSSEYPENLIIPTNKGDMVRSKSEALIANALYDMNIPYRYEELLLTKASP